MGLCNEGEQVGIQLVPQEATTHWESDLVLQPGSSSDLQTLSSERVDTEGQRWRSLNYGCLCNANDNNTTANQMCFDSCRMKCPEF